MDRRDFVKTLGIMGASALPGKKSYAEELENDKEFFGLLVDTTRCVGCQTCMEACAEANNLPEPDLDAIDEGIVRKTNEKQWTLVNRFEIEDQEIFVKKQCMHCNQPACATACPTKALLKTEEGPVIYDSGKCMGCRYCMMACPYGIPRYDWESPTPYVRKCTMCHSRIVTGRVPACVEACPENANIFGVREELIQEAHHRIEENPERYIHAVTGEMEVGGSSVLYISDIPLGFLSYNPKPGDQPLPSLTWAALSKVPPLIIGMGGLMTGIYWIVERRMKLSGQKSTTIESRAEKGNE